MIRLRIENMKEGLKKRLAELDALLNMGQKDVVLDTVPEGEMLEHSSIELAR